MQPMTKVLKTVDRARRVGDGWHGMRLFAEAHEDRIVFRLGEQHRTHEGKIWWPPGGQILAVGWRNPYRPRFTFGKRHQMTVTEATLAAMDAFDRIVGECQETALWQGRSLETVAEIGDVVESVSKLTRP